MKKEAVKALASEDNDLGNGPIVFSGNYTKVETDPTKRNTVTVAVASHKLGADEEEEKGWDMKKIGIVAGGSTLGLIFILVFLYFACRKKTPERPEHGQDDGSDSDESTAAL